MGGGGALEDIGADRGLKFCAYFDREDGTRQGASQARQVQYASFFNGNQVL